MYNVIIEIDFFETVYLNTDPNQYPRQVIEARLLPGGVVKYVLTSENELSTHYREEFSTEPNEDLKNQFKEP